MVWGEILATGVQAYSGRGDNAYDWSLTDTAEYYTDLLKNDTSDFFSLGSQHDLATGGWDVYRQQNEQRRYDRRITGVNQAFSTAFGREPTQEELTYWEDKVNRGEYTSPQQIVYELRNSPEYAQMQQERYNQLVSGAGEGMGQYAADLASRDFSGVIPKATQGPLGAYGRTKDNILQYTEAPELSAKRGSDLDAYLNTLSTIGVTGDARAAQINETSNVYMQNLLSKSLPQLEQSLIGRGLRGSEYYGRRVGEAITGAAESAALNRESLFAQDEALKLQQLGQFQTGLSQDYSTLLNAQQQAESALFGREQLAQGYYSTNAQLQAQMLQAQSSAEQRAHEFALEYQMREEEKADELLKEQTGK